MAVVQSKYRDAAQMEANIDNATPYVGENGNWWRWDINTEVYTDSGSPARGPKGAKGEKGEQGPIGPAGSPDGTATYTHRREGTVHQLSGSGKHLAFLVTADYLPGESFTVNGQPVAAVTLDGYPLPAGSFKVGVWILAVLDGERLTFQFRAKLGDGTGLTWGELDNL